MNRGTEKRTGNATEIRDLLGNATDLSSKIEKPQTKTTEKRNGVFPVVSQSSQPAEDRVPLPYSDRQLSFVRASARAKLAHNQPLDDLLEYAADLGMPIDAWHPDYFAFGQRGSSQPKTIEPKIEPETCLCCESTVYWRDRNGTTHCARCRKPPQPSFVESIWRVCSQRDDSGKLQTWWEKGSEDDAPGGKSGWKWLQAANKRVKFEHEPMGIDEAELGF